MCIGKTSVSAEYFTEFDLTPLIIILEIKISHNNLLNSEVLLPTLSISASNGTKIILEGAILDR